MINIEYDKKKEYLLSLFEKYMDMRKLSFKLSDGSEIIIEDDIDIKSLNNKVKSLSESVFRLVVLGEFNAGKSTFINAFLGEKILPDDILQSTSSIIEIFKSAEKHLLVKYADERVEKVDGSLAVDFLRKNAAIQDEYRKLPVTQLNAFLVEKKGDFSVHDLKPLFEILDNYYNLSKIEFENKVYSYLKEFKNKWMNFVVSIEYGYPLSFESDGLRLVDSPGVNAKGKVEDITFDYMNKSDAVIFISRIDNIGSSSFNDFYKKATLNRLNESLFLIFTHTSDKNDEQIQRLMGEAGIMFGNISKKKLTYVDSKLELILNTIKDMDTDEIKRYMRSDKTIHGMLSWYFEISEGNKENVIEELVKASNFESVNTMLNDFAFKAKYNQLLEIINTICAGYEQIISKIKEQINLDSSKLRNPQEVEGELYRRKKALNDVKELFNLKTEELYSKYSAGSDVIRNFIAKKNNLKDRVNSQSDYSAIKATTQNIIDEIKSEIKLIGDSIVADCNSILEELSAKRFSDITIPVPYIDTEKFYDDLEEEAFESVEKRKCFKKEKVNQYSPTKHINLLKKTIANEIDLRMSDGRAKLCGSYKNNGYIHQIIDDFKNELKTVLDKRQKYYEEYAAIKINQEEIRNLVDKETKKKDEVEKAFKDIQSLQGDVKCCI